MWIKQDDEQDISDLDNSNILGPNCDIEEGGLSEEESHDCVYLRHNNNQLISPALITPLIVKKK